MCQQKHRKERITQCVQCDNEKVARRCQSNSISIGKHAYLFIPDQYLSRQDEHRSKQKYLFEDEPISSRALNTCSCAQHWTGVSNEQKSFHPNSYRSFETEQHARCPSLPAFNWSIVSRVFSQRIRYLFQKSFLLLFDLAFRHVRVSARVPATIALDERTLDINDPVQRAESKSKRFPCSSLIAHEMQLQ